MQLSFEFLANQQNQYREEDFILSTENKKTHDFLTKFFVQEKFKNSLFPSAIIYGEEQCGKTHLLNIFAAKNPQKIHFLKEEELLGVDLSVIFNENEFYILEDVEKIADKKLLLHIINCATQQSAFLIMSSQINPQNIDYEIKDLNSRLKNIFCSKIEAPKKKLIKILLVKNLAKKQLALNDKIINFIVDSINKSYRGISDFIKIIEIFCQQNQKRLTLTTISKLMKNGNSDEKK